MSLKKRGHTCNFSRVWDDTVLSSLGANSARLVCQLLLWTCRDTEREEREEREILPFSEGKTDNPLSGTDSQLGSYSLGTEENSERGRERERTCPIRNGPFV
jgi:hypothetical protein